MTAWGKKTMEQVAQDLRRECLAVFGTTWNNDVAERFARAAFLASTAALREPSPEMLHAATMIVPTWDDNISREKMRAMLTRADEELG